MIKRPTFLYYLDEASPYFKIGFFPKFFFFILISIFGLVNKDYLVNLALALVVLLLIVQTGFVGYNKKPFKLLGIAILVFVLFWTFVSNIPGDVTYFSFPWGTVFSDKTEVLMLLAISRWLLVVMTGLYFMVIGSEGELVEFLISLKAPPKLILTFTIAFNTVCFAISDLERVDVALKARNFDDRTIYGKIKKVFHIGVLMLISNLKRIETLNQSYTLRAERYEKINGKNAR